MNKTIIIATITILVLALGYITFDKYTDYQEVKLQEATQAGIEYTLNQVTQALIQQAETCEPITISEEVQLINIRCLQVGKE